MIEVMRPPYLRRLRGGGLHGLPFDPALWMSGDRPDPGLCGNVWKSGGFFANGCRLLCILFAGEADRLRTAHRSKSES